MKSKRYKKLPQNTKELKADLIKNLLNLISLIVSLKFENLIQSASFQS